jgi:hypothetical protein
MFHASGLPEKGMAGTKEGLGSRPGRRRLLQANHVNTSMASYEMMSCEAQSRLQAAAAHQEADVVRAVEGGDARTQVSGGPGAHRTIPRHAACGAAGSKVNTNQ